MTGSNCVIDWYFLLTFPLLCSKNVKFLSRNPFWKGSVLVGTLLKNAAGWLLLLFLREKTTCCGCLQPLGLNEIFHCYSPLEILIRSPLSSVLKIYRTTEKMDALLTKSVKLESNSLGKSFKYPWKNKRPKNDLCRTPPLLGSQLEDWLSRTLLCCLFLRILFIRR